MANKRFIDFPIATTVGDNDIILIWQGGANKQTTKATILSGVPDSLNDLTDVTISGLTNGQILRYDSVTGQWENTDQGNLDLNDLNDVTIVSPTNGQVLVYNSSTGKWENSSGGYVPYVGAVTTVNLGAQTIQAGSFVKQGGTSSQFLKANGSVDSTAYGTGSVTSVGLTMPAAFNVANSPITTAGTLAVTGAGTVAQYIRGDGSLADFPESSGGGSSVSYYLNGSVNQGTIGGIAYKELSKVPILGAGTDFTINADGYIASFITDAGDPNLLEIPGGNWNFETYFSASSSGGTPTFYVELYKVSSGGTATLIASSSSAPELIAFGTNLNPYFSTLAVPTTTLALTDRLAVRYYVTHSGRTITLHTENNHLCQIITTFTTGLTALNGLTAQVQNFAVGTTGTDFNIASATATHTFNLPTASATNRGALSSADWSTFNAKQNALTLTTSGTSGAATLIGATLNIPNYGSALSGYLPLIGGTMTGNINWGQTDRGLTWLFNTDGASIKFYNTGDGDTNSRLEFATLDNNNEYFRWVHIPDGGTTYESMRLVPNSNGNAQLIVSGSIIKQGGTSSQYLMADGSVSTLTNPVTGTGSAGQVAYWSSGSAITGESALFWDATNNRLGIDNASPDAPIHANGGASMTAGWNRTATLQAQYPVLVYNSNGSKWAGIGYDYTAGLRIWVNSSSSDVSSGTNALFIDNSGAATFNSTVTASSFVKSGGTSSQFLKADGSVDSTSYVPFGRTITINGTTQDLSANRTFNVGTVTSVTASSPLASSGGTTPNITIQQASGSQSGFLSSTDWTTFNNKQNALTNPVTGTGTSGQVAYFNGTTSITSESNLFWDATNDRLGIGINSPSFGLDIQSTVAANAYLRVLFTGYADTYIQSFSNGGYIGTNNDYPLFIRTNNVTRLTIANFTGAATFSSSVTASGILTSTAGVTMSGGWVRNMLLQSAFPVQVFESNHLGTSRFAGIGYDRTGGMAFWVNSTTVDVTSNNNVFYLANSGAATFSSSVNVGGVSANTDFRIYRTVAPSVFFSISAPGGTPNTSILGVNGTDVMALNASGNVLIGTINEVGAKLNIQRPNDSGALIRLGNVDLNYFDFSRSQSTGALSIQGNQTGFNNIVLAPTSGNVLIGTTTDNGLGARLQVRTLATITGPSTAGLSVRNESGVFAQLSIGVSAGFVGTTSNHQLNFTANSVVLATLKTDGEFQTNAISTSSPVGGTAAIWKLGKVATVSPTSPNRTIEVEVAGTIYYLHAKTTNN